MKQWWNMLENMELDIMSKWWNMMDTWGHVKNGGNMMNNDDVMMKHDEPYWLMIFAKGLRRCLEFLEFGVWRQWIQTANNRKVRKVHWNWMFVCFFLVGFMVGNGESAAKQGYQPSPSCGKPNTELARIYKKLCVRMNHQKTMPKIGGFKVLFQIRWFSSCFMRGNRFWRWS